MIADKIGNLRLYSKCHPNLKRAIDALDNLNLRSLPDGRFRIDGDNVFIIHSTSELLRDETLWEAHEKYADIQIVLKGRECISWSSNAELGDYDCEKDFYPCKVISQSDFIAEDGGFLLFMPREPHSPGNYIMKGEKVEKAIVKVLID